MLAFQLFTIGFICLSGSVKGQSGDLGDLIQDLIEELIPPLACLGGDSTPLKCDPGDVLFTTSTRTVNSSLDSVMWNDAVSEIKVALGFSVIGNKDVTNPQWYMEEGEIDVVPSYDLPSSRTILLLFTKGNFNFGVSGVLSYDIEDTDYKIAMMFTSTTQYEMSYNAKIFPKSYSTDESLYNHLLNSAGAWTPQEDWSQYQTRSEYGLEIEAVMSPRSRGSKYMVRLSNRGYDPEQGPELQLACQYREGRGYEDYYCSKECLELGSCFTEIKCNSEDNCSHSYPCSTSCN